MFQRDQGQGGGYLLQLPVESLGSGGKTVDQPLPLGVEDGQGLLGIFGQRAEGVLDTRTGVR